MTFGRVANFFVENWQNIVGGIGGAGVIAIFSANQPAYGEVQPPSRSYSETIEDNKNKQLHDINNNFQLTPEEKHTERFRIRSGYWFMSAGY